MSQTRRYIELDRQFLPLNSERETEESVSRSYLGSTWLGHSGVGWSDLLNQKRIVILGEAGSGKTWEIRHQCEAQRNAGKAAFYFELEQLISRKPQQLLSQSDSRDFERWLTGSKQCIIFLDSVDEAKLRRQIDFHRALESLHQSLDLDAIARVQLVITSRISEWQPSTDKEALQRLFCSIPSRLRSTANTSATEEAAEQIDISIYQIAPLDRERVSTLVSGLGLTDYTSFLDAVDARSVWEFARRPLDVFGLVEFWQSNGRLGTLTEMIEHDIASKLRETSQRIRDDCLSVERARQGAECLAAATILCRSPSFKVPDDSFLSPTAIDAVDCLPEDWTSAEASALLSRPLFDGAAYGHVRFHHRRVAEYLASRWISCLMSEGCTTIVLKDLLASKYNDSIALRRSLLPVTAWLAAGEEDWNEQVRNWILSSSPEIHLQFGDPELLSLPYRRELLRAWIQSQSDRDSVWVDSSPDTLSRLADPNLASDVTELLKERANSIDVRSELVYLVRFGRLIDCLPVLIDILSDSKETDRLKCNAMAAIRDMGTVESRRDVWRLLESYPTLSDRLCSVACEALYPQVISANQLAKLLEKTESPDDDFHSLLWTLEHHVTDYVPSCEAFALLDQLQQLTRKPPYLLVFGKETHISSQFRWILQLLPAIILLLLKNKSLNEPEIQTAANGLDLISEAREARDFDSKVKDELSSITQNHPEVRQEFFWRVVSRLSESGHDRHPHVLLRMDFGEVLTPCSDDIAWLIDDVTARSDLHERKIALGAALMMLSRRDRLSKRRLKQASKDNAVLRKMFRSHCSKDRWAWYYRLRNSFADDNRKFRVQRWRHSLIRYWQFMRDQWYLFRHLSSIRRGTLTYPLARLCREAEHTGHKWSPTNWDNVAKRRGRYITQAARKGCKAAWREFQPKLPHEKEEPNQIDNRVVVGLAGLEASFQDDAFFSQGLSEQDARNAVRYAINEMNGYPEWLSSVVANHEPEVAHVLNECVLGEWNYPVDREFVHDAISRISWEGDRLAKLVRQQVLTCLSIGDPPNRKVLEDSLNLLLKTVELPEIELGDLALTHCRDMEIDSDAFPLWAGVAVQLQADSALNLLEDRLSGSVIADQVWLNMCELLGGHLRPLIITVAKPDFLQVTALRRLIYLVFQHVRPADDIKRSGGAYSPTSRDEAQRFRDGLITRLAESESGDATEELRELLKNDFLCSYHDWIRHLINKRVRECADGPPWREIDIRRFAQQIRNPTHLSKPQMRILFLAANPLTTDALDLEQEIRSLEIELRGVKYRDQVTLDMGHAVRSDDLVRCVREFKPNIIHFSGHGTNTGIVFRDDSGGEQHVNGAALRRFLNERGVDLVVLNACSSKDVALEILGAVKTVVGTTDDLDDEDAGRFTVAFYRSLGEGLTVRDALRDGGDEVALHGGVDIFYSEGDLDAQFVCDV